MVVWPLKGPLPADLLHVPAPARGTKASCPNHRRCVRRTRRRGTTTVVRPVPGSGFETRGGRRHLPSSSVADHPPGSVGRPDRLAPPGARLPARRCRTRSAPRGRDQRGDLEHHTSPEMGGVERRRCDRLLLTIPPNLRCVRRHPCTRDAPGLRGGPRTLCPGKRERIAGVSSRRPPQVHGPGGRRAGPRVRWGGGVTMRPASFSTMVDTGGT